MRRGVALLGLLGTLLGCSTFPVIEADECGNGVREKGEDCDTATGALRGGVCRPKGVVGECHWDCQLNVDGTRGACPDGYGCASDSICREFTGRLEAPVPLSSDLSSWLSSVDFDGDGRPELLSMELSDQVQQGRFAIHYFDRDTNLVETRVFPRVTTRPIAAKLDEKSGDDLVFSNFRVGMLPGRADRELVPAAFSSYVVDGSELFAVSVTDNQIGEAVGLAAFTALRGVEGIYLPDSDDNGRLKLRAGLAHPLAQLVATPDAAELFVGPGSPCSEIIYGFKGDWVVHVLDMCEVGTNPLGAELAWRETPRETLVTLPAGAKLDARPLSADLDGDGHLDLLISGSGVSYVAYGDGLELQTRAEPLKVSIQGTTQPQGVSTVLAAGDITGDGVADLVGSIAVFSSLRSLIDGRTVYVQSFGNNAAPWTMAVIADLNGNQKPDVIAATAGERGLSFLNGTGDLFPVGERIATRGPVRLVSTGNFDGDSSADIAFVEGAAAGDDSDSLWVAYGQQDSSPRTPVRIAELNGVQQLGRQRARGLDDIFTASRRRVDGKSIGTFTLFNGDASRLPLAPYTLVEFKKDDSLADYIAPALLLGAFTQPDQHDVIALGTRNVFQGWNQWLVPNFGAGLEPPRLLQGEPMLGVAPATDGGARGIRLSIAGAAADVDGDGLDEAVWLMPEGPAGCALLVYDIEPGTGIGEDTGRVSLRSKLSFGEPCAEPVLSAADLDADGRADLLLLLGETGTGSRPLQVLWNDDGFSLAARTLLDDGQDGNARGFSLLDDSAGIAFVTRTALFRAERAYTKTRQFDVREVVGTFRDAQSVVVADPNGDGFSDMVVADAAGLWLLKAELR